MRYEIRIDCILDERWSNWFDEFKITNEPDGVTSMTGSIVDDAALHGVLTKIRDLGLPIVSVRRADITDS
jgi:hypothetical protein